MILFLIAYFLVMGIVYQVALKVIKAQDKYDDVNGMSIVAGFFWPFTVTIFAGRGLGVVLLRLITKLMKKNEG